MKKRSASVIAVAAVLMLLGAAAASAGDLIVRGEIPFAFVVDNTEMPAGVYLISRVSDNNDAPLRITNKLHGKGSAMFLTGEAAGSNASGHPELVFNRYGDRYFLRQVWTGTPGAGYQLPESRSEREQVTIQIHAGNQPEVVRLAASLR